MEKIKRLVSYYVKMFDTNNPFDIANALEIHVMQTPLGNVAGNYKYLQRSKWVFINSDIEDEAFKQTIMAHELGHAILHSKENCCFMAHHTLLLTSRIERQANMFAAYLLITDEMLEQFNGFTIEQFSNCTGLGQELIDLRIKNDL